MYKIVSHTYFSMVSGLNPFGFEAITKTWDARYIMRFDTMANFIPSCPKIIKYGTSPNINRSLYTFHPIFHYGLYCRAVNLCSKQRSFSISKIVVHLPDGRSF